MKAIPVLFCLLCCSFSTFSDDGISLETSRGEVLKNVRLRELQGDVAVIWHSGGIAKVPIPEIPDEAREALGLATTHQLRSQARELKRKDSEAARNGLIRYGDSYVTPEEKADRELTDKAISIVMAKSERGVAYEVLQVLGKMILCSRGQVKPSGKIEFTLDIFALAGIDTYTLAEDERYQHDIFWCGTYSYVTLLGVEKTVPMYVSEYDEAVRRVRLDMETKEGSGERPVSAGVANAGSSAGVAVGTGFAITVEGDILTNFHVVKDGKRVEVKVGETLYPASVVASDSELDLAVVRVGTTTQPVQFSPNEVEQLGTECFAVGFPNIHYQGVNPKVTKGIISGLGGPNRDKNLYQIDAAVQPGNSGGPVSDRSGNIVGVVVGGLNQLKVLIETGQIPQNVNFCISRGGVMDFLDAHSEIRKKIRVGVRREMATEDALETVIRATYLIVCTR